MQGGADRPQLDDVRTAHLVGIGGTAMTPLATILIEKGVAISGSDVTDNPALDQLRAKGARIAIGHRAENVGRVDVVDGEGLSSLLKAPAARSTSATASAIARMPSRMSHPPPQRGR